MSAYPFVKMAKVQSFRVPPVLLKLEILYRKTERQSLMYVKEVNAIAPDE